MKTATIPSLRVNEELRNAAENVLEEGETLSGFVVQSIRDSVDRRRAQQEFIARGLLVRDEVRKTGDYVSAKTVFANLEKKLLKAEAQAQKKASVAAKTKTTASRK